MNERMRKENHKAAKDLAATDGSRQGLSQGAIETRLFFIARLLTEEPPTKKLKDCCVVTPPLRKGISIIFFDGMLLGSPRDHFC